MIGETNNTHGFIGTVIVHSIFIAILFLVTISASLPDSENEGLLINFGNSTDGSGLVEPIVNYDNAVFISLPTHQSKQRVEEKKILTQDFEDAPTVETKKKTTKKDTKKVIKETTTTSNKNKDTKETKETKETDNTKQTQTTETVKQQTVNKKALFPGKALTGGTGGEGETGKEGNQGSLEGSPESTNRTGGATGGNGIGDGNGNGNGINFSLNGRTALKLPKPDYLKQKQGIVVVQVYVDKKGNVTKAIPGVKGSTTLDNDLLKAAEKAAMTAKFDLNENAKESQTGTITYIFKLQ